MDTNRVVKYKNYSAIEICLLFFRIVLSGFSNHKNIQVYKQKYKPLLPLQAIFMTESIKIN